MSKRNPVSDVEAVAAMPGLEQMAEAMEQAAPRQRESSRDNMSLLILAAGSRAFTSQEKLASALTHGGLWPQVRRSAARVGRQLPPWTPSPDTMDRLLASRGAELATEVERTLNVTAIDLAQSMGLLSPSVPLAWDPPLREHHLTGDGTVAKTLSEVTEENKFEKSRAADPATGARVCDMYVGKNVKEIDKRKLGAPFVVVSTHSHRRHERVVFGLETYQDGNEIDAAMRVFDRVIPLARGGVHTVHYDRLMDNTHVQQLMQRHGVIPIVEMHRAASRHVQALDVPANHEDYQRGKQRQHAPKLRVQTRHYGIFSHQGGNGETHWHRLWMVDGQPHVTGMGTRVISLDAPALELVDVDRRWAEGRCEMHTTYRVPCDRHGDFMITVDLAQDAREVDNDCRALEHIAGGRTRILNERHTAFWEVAGRRSDSESTIDVIKRTLPLRGRASRLQLDNFAWDLIGAALLINAQAWDVHVAQHTPAGQAEYARQQRAAKAA